MRLFRQIIFSIALFASFASFAVASREETTAFKNATKVFADHMFYQAERDFSGFIGNFPASEHRREAILFLAQSRYYQTNYSAAIEILQKELPQAGALLDQYQFWIGESFFAAGKFEAAAKSYRELLGGVQKSSLRLKASYNEALAYSKLKNWSRVIDLLGRADGDFQTASQGQTESESVLVVLNGNLLLAEALATKDQFAEAERVLFALNKQELKPLDKWRREFLATKILMAQSRLEGALQNSTNLLTLAATVSDRTAVAESVGLQAEILERLNRLPEAIDTYQKNLVEGLPVSMRRRALFKTVDLTLHRGKTAEAVRKLQTFVDDNPQDPAVDIALITLGELQLRQSFDLSDNPTNGVSSLERQTNLVQQAYTNFLTIKTNFAQSEFLGKALLDIGWCFWTQQDIDEAEKNFAEATKILPVSEDKAMAIFKRADCQFKKGDYANAAANYDILVENFGELERVKSGLVDQALYQLVRAGIASTNQAMAESAAKKILELYPNSFFADRSLLLLGQGLNKQGKPSEARAIFSDLLKHFPDSKLRSHAELAVARTYVQEKQWAKAIAQYEMWEKSHPDDSMFADAEFSRALAYAQTGEEPSALVLMTNLVARFPTNSLGARAESWVGDYYFNNEEYIKAEANYQEVLKHNPEPELFYQAHLMAGRAAFARAQSPKDFDEVTKYYLPVINDGTNTPAPILAEAYYALGDALFQQVLANTNRSEDAISGALSALSSARDLSTNSPLAGRAWGRIGDFHYQWALMNTNATDLAKARNAYEQTLAFEFSDGTCRNQAQVGLGKISEKEGNLVAALVQYRKVLDDEGSDPFWAKEAGLAVARILEVREEWDPAARVYERLARILPSLGPTLEKKIASARAHLEGAKK